MKQICSRSVSTHHATAKAPLKLPCLKNCANLFLSERRQISTNFDNIWHKDGKETKITRGSLIFHLI